jgi:putative transposase
MLPAPRSPDGRTIREDHPILAERGGARSIMPVTNLLERLHEEFKRRIKIIPNAFGEKAVLKLMYGAMIRAAERWRGLPVTAFERRQLEAIKAELDAEYQTSIGRPPAAPQPKISSNHGP